MAAAPSQPPNSYKAATCSHTDDLPHTKDKNTHCDEKMPADCRLRERTRLITHGITDVLSPNCVNRNNPSNLASSAGAQNMSCLFSSTIIQ